MRSTHARHEDNGLKLLKLCSVCANELNRFVAEHPLVAEFLLKDHHLETDDAVSFIRQMKSLKRIGFQVTDHLQRDRIMNSLNNEWELKVPLEHLPLYIELNC